MLHVGEMVREKNAEEFISYQKAAKEQGAVLMIGEDGSQGNFKQFTFFYFEDKSSEI